MIIVITLTQQTRCSVICGSVGEMANFKWPADGQIYSEKLLLVTNTEGKKTAVKNIFIKGTLWR